MAAVDGTMPTEMPKTKDEFVEWSTGDTCGEFNDHARAWFQANQSVLIDRVQLCDFVGSLPEALGDAAAQFHAAHQSLMFNFGRMPKFLWNRKPYSSFVEKLFRMNCVDNKGFPAPPDGGWVALQDAFGRMDDIVRTTFVVGYADAPDVLVGQLKLLANRLGVPSRVKDHTQEKGYYAHHVYFGVEMPVSAAIGSAAYTDTVVEVEIQVTTELQGALREITHRLYEQERLEGGLAIDWKSQFDSGRFRAAYMAHSLRFIEAMIVDLRASVNAEHEGEQ